MKILFVMASAEYLRYYDSTIQLLAARGHELVIAVNHDRGEKKPVRLEELGREIREGEENREMREIREGIGGNAGGSIAVLGVLPGAQPWWGRVARGLRGTMDFVRYLDPHFAGAHALRARIRRKVLPRPLHLLDRIPSLGRAGTRRLVRALAVLERAIPTVPVLDRTLAGLAPDAIVVSPLVDAASEQVDLVKSARRLGIPIAAGIASWDNLTNKGLLRVTPDLVLVWNAIQQREAVDLHGIPPERVAVTGAQPFDRWFDRTPSRDPVAFCRRAGLAGATPFVLFTCSSGFISQGQAEVAFVRRWIASVRAGAAPIPILVRPHPYNARAWVDADLSDLPGVALWPRGPYNPVDEDNRADFFDSLHHSAAVVGINTSAMIEAAIVGRPVLSIRTAEFAGTQEGTLHFHYLLPENGGFLRVAGTLEEHVRQLSDVLANPALAREQAERFVDRFIRPHGRLTPATPVVADAIESLPARRRPARGPGAAVMLRPLMWTLAAAAATADALQGDAWTRARKQLRMRWHRARKTVGRLGYR